MRIEQIATPALILDLDCFEENLQKLQAYVEGSGTVLRPHYKSNKCSAIAHRQIAAGARGITCAKLTEAEDLADAGVEDILIANQIVDPDKIARLPALAKKCHLTVCVDDEENIRALSAAVAAFGGTLHCYVEFEVGMARCGVAEFERVEALIRLIEALPGLQYTGIQAYAGHLSHEFDKDARIAASKAVDAKLMELKDWLADRGIAIGEVSGVSTGTVFEKVPGEIYTEFQTGSYIFLDASYGQMELPLRHALFVLSTVISRSPGRIVTDAGMKTVAVDQGMPVAVGFECAELSMSEEHVTILADADLKRNDKVKIIPSHCCTTINLFNKLYVIRNGKVVDRWAITSRGNSQ